MERNRLERLDQAYSIFNGFQILTLIAGICAAFAAWGTLYMICLFGQAVAMIIFGVISSNLVEYLARKKYPELKPDKTIRIGVGSFRYSMDFNRPMRERAKKADDRLLLDVMSKQTRMWVLCIANVLILGIMPSTAAWVLGLLG